MTSGSGSDSFHLSADVADESFDQSFSDGVCQSVTDGGEKQSARKVNCLIHGLLPGVPPFFPNLLKSRNILIHPEDEVAFSNGEDAFEASLTFTIHGQSSHWD